MQNPLFFITSENSTKTVPVRCAVHPHNLSDKPTKFFQSLQSENSSVRFIFSQYKCIFVIFMWEYVIHYDTLTHLLFVLHIDCHVTQHWVTHVTNFNCHAIWCNTSIETTTIFSLLKSYFIYFFMLILTSLPIKYIYFFTFF